MVRENEIRKSFFPIFNSTNQSLIHPFIYDSFDLFHSFNSNKFKQNLSIDSPSSHTVCTVHIDFRLLVNVWPMSLLFVQIKTTQENNNNFEIDFQHWALFTSMRQLVALCCLVHRSPIVNNSSLSFSRHFISNWGFYLYYTLVCSSFSLRYTYNNIV